MAMRLLVLPLSHTPPPCRSRSSSTSITPIALKLWRSSTFIYPADHIVCARHRRHFLSTTTVAALPLIVDPAVASMSLNASCNLVALCGFIILMQKCGHLPSNTALVLSQVSFNLIIPCFLMAKVSSTIAAHRDWTFLSLPLLAFVQVFLNGMLSHTDYSSAAGYLALYMMGWSPCLWTLGYQIMSSTSGPLDKTSTRNSKFSPNKLAHWWKKLMNPPLYGVLVGVLVGATPLSYLFLPSKHKMLVAYASTKRSFLLSTCSVMSSILQPIFEGATLLGSATVPLQAIVLASTVANSIEEKRQDEAQQLTVNGSMIMLESKGFWVITVIRLLLIPLIFLALLHAIKHCGWLPADPLSKFVLLVVAAMPTAQNLVVLAQLQAGTRPFAGVLANLLVRQYLIAVVSLTLWIPIFYSFLHLG